MLTQAPLDVFQVFHRTPLSGWHVLQVAALTCLAALAGLLIQPGPGLPVLWPANALLATAVITLGTAYGWILFGDAPPLAGTGSWAMASLRLGVRVADATMPAEEAARSRHDIH